jgi:predicted SprT family Zn-dependent metalloprotease
VSRDLLVEAVCHGLAHDAAYRLHGPFARPHGPEWKRLVTRAGFSSRTRAITGEAARRRKSASRHPTYGGVLGLVQGPRH